MITIDWFLPGYKAGGPIRSCANLVAHLQEEYDFFILTRNTDYNSKEPYPGVKPDTWQRLFNVNIYYFSSAYLSYKSLKKVITDVRPDVIYINGIFSRYFSIYPLIISRSLYTERVLVAGRGMFAPGAREVKGGKKNLFFKIARFVGLYRNINFHATNEMEAGYIKEVLGMSTPVLVASNLAAKPGDKESADGVRKLPNQLRLVSFARISPEKNTLYALQLLASYQYDGEIVYDLFGQLNDSGYWAACQEIIKSLPAHIEVSYRGSIENTLIPATLQQYHALFLPTKGENFGHAILESLVEGVPVIISDKTPWRNLVESNVGFDLPLEQPEQFRNALSAMLAMEQEAYEQMKQDCKEFALAVLKDEEVLEANRSLFA
ncbi:glycosyltransferase [Botryobacter ruber]|uniref:glycosyltransferase n=1 Tax=Botryobacter ruber TaxID=2171629 RepID=UPI0013E3A1C9|nr:glycosyltransferase [Botryobacter ruber]